MWGSFSFDSTGPDRLGSGPGVTQNRPVASRSLAAQKELETLRDTTAETYWGERNSGPTPVSMIATGESRETHRVHQNSPGCTTFVEAHAQAVPSRTTDPEFRNDFRIPLPRPRPPL